MKLDLYKDKDWVYNAYVKKRNSAAQIAIYCGVSRSTIIYWMKKHGIEKRWNDGMKVSDIREVQGFESLIGWIAAIVVIIVLIGWLFKC